MHIAMHRTHSKAHNRILPAVMIALLDAAKDT